MKKVIFFEETPSFTKKLREINEGIVLAGGCFDILHKGHLIFLEKAKEYGGKLIILLEDDENVKKLKGSERPMHTQEERARILSSVKFVDYIIMLTKMKNSQDYAKLINQIKPNVIAITNDDPYIKEKIEQAKNVGAKLVSVTKRVAGKSTTELVNLLKNN